MRGIFDEPTGLSSPQTQDIVDLWLRVRHANHLILTWVRNFKTLGAIFSAPDSIFSPQNAPDAFSAPIGKLKKTP